MRIFKAVIFVIFTLLFLLGVMIVLSPYGKSDGFNYRLVKRTVDIHASPDSVFKFLSNSGNATQWSVFVDHIATLNPDSIKDGQPGSRRRCFCEKDDSGKRWDETITEVVPGVKRQLTCYDYKGFPLTVGNIATEQLYET